MTYDANYLPRVNIRPMSFFRNCIIIYYIADFSLFSVYISFLCLWFSVLVMDSNSICMVEFLYLYIICFQDQKIVYVNINSLSILLVGNLIKDGCI